VPSIICEERFERRRVGELATVAKGAPPTWS
jgi:hypothetical protein